jgi:hypothetical protein
VVGAEFCDPLSDARILLRDVLEIPRDESNLRAVLDSEGAVAVPLHVVRPDGTFGEPYGGRGQHRSNRQKGQPSRPTISLERCAPLYRGRDRGMGLTKDL